MDNLETNIQQLRMSVEELEKRIKAISSQVTVNTQVTATKACLEEIKELLLQFQDSYNEHLNYCFLSESEHMAEYQEFSQNTNTRLNSIDSNTNFAVARTVELQEDFDELTQKVNQLEQMCIETENIANNTEIKCNDLEYKIDGYDLTIQELQSDTKSALNQCDSLSSRMTNAEQEIDELKQSSTNTELEQTVNNLQTQVEQNKNDISKNTADIEQNKNDISKNTSDITQNKNDISSNASDISFVRSSVNNLDQQVQSLNQTVQNAQTVFSELRPVIEENQSNITTLQNENNTLFTNIDDLSGRVKSLENGSGSSSSGGGQCNQNVDFYNLQNNQFNFFGPYASPYFYINCDKNSLVDLDITLTGEVTDFIESNQIVLQLTVNDEVYTQQVGLAKEGDYKHTFCFPILTNKTTNKCRLSFNRYAGTTWVSTLSIKAKGNNVSIYCADKNLSIYCFNQEYYIVGRNQNKFIFYGVCPKDSFDINNINLEQYAVSANGVDNVIMPIFYPTTSSTSTSITSSNSNQFMYICPDKNDQVYYGVSDSDSSGYSTNLTEVTKQSICIDALPYGKSYGGYTHLFIDTQNTAKIAFTKLFGMKTDTTVVLNGENVQDCIYGTLVKNNNLNFGNSAPTPINGMVLTTSDGTNWFYPAEASSYRVEIAKGKNATAYLQADNTINVYINQGINVCRYVLAKNAEGNYALDDTKTTTYYGYTRIEEAFDDMVFAYKYDKVFHKSLSLL